MFRSSADLRADVTYKVLAWGPTGAGKSHFAFSAPEPAVVDFEHRASQLAHAFPPGHFQAVEPPSIRDAIAALEAIAAGNVPCRTIVLDSLSRPYQTFVKAAMGENGVVDWPVVNRRMLTITEPTFSIPKKNVIAIARQATRMEREGRDFKRRGVKMIGDEQRWPFDYDFVLHFAGRGAVEVQKSMSTHLPVGTQIRGDLDFARFVRLATGEESIEAAREAKPGARQRAPEPDPVAQDFPGHEHRLPAHEPTPLEIALAELTDDQRHAIGEAARAKGMKPARLLLHIRSIAGGEPLPKAKVALLLDLIAKDVAA